MHCCLADSAPDAASFDITAHNENTDPEHPAMMQVQTRVLVLDAAPLHPTTAVTSGQAFDAAAAAGVVAAFTRSRAQQRRGKEHERNDADEDG